MDLKDYLDTPPWEWPPDSAARFKQILANKQASADDRLTAAELAGDYTVINDELASLLLSIIGSTDEAEELRAGAAISLGAALESADTDGFDDTDLCPISERTFQKLQSQLHKLFMDKSVPKQVRRRILESSVRASEDWHRAAIHDAYASNDHDWMLTAVFAMAWMRGFDKQILEALESEQEDIQREAVNAAGNWELDEAWGHVFALAQSEETEKSLRIAAIHAIAGIRPIEASELLTELVDSPDKEIAEEAEEALSEAGYMSHELDEDSHEDEEEPPHWIN